MNRFFNSENIITYKINESGFSTFHVGFDIDDKGNPEDISVVCSNITTTSWIFTTIQSPDDQQHPVSGNREFGIKTISNKFYFYTQGSDRITGYLDLFENYYDPFTDPNSIFSGADKLWKSVLDKVCNYINKNGGKSNIKYPQFSRRIKWK